jgi:hypothetical protein
MKITLTHAGNFAADGNILTRSEARDLWESCQGTWTPNAASAMANSLAAAALRAIPSTAREAASRENGKKGGRPRKHAMPPRAHPVKMPIAGVDLA